ncbi:hypothetical protein [Mycobacterium vicinigordonae]|uniref:Glycosyltransferase RgtA/B/C/D-like domain-containing protein n=1 Tax=Mycobacterium vicinigordonae TaxID=1719132 RepID=A0A7D6HWZ7_9MYCO|nr:hypothetical protein [Mycobacterium vicinigordonae]QLL09612.1 hypothetical protein H0P51_12515 [Mycobacterium vicinigordonae]
MAEQDDQQHSPIDANTRTADSVLNASCDATTSSAESLSESPPHPKVSFGLLAAVACVVLGAKLLVISVLGSPSPLLDQWDGEGDNLYVPYLRDELTISHLFASHNEHQIVLFRLLALFHLELAGEWNPRLEMILGALIHVVVVTWLVALLIPLISPQRRLLSACFIAFVFALPIGYENLLWGFQDQIYFSLLFGLATIAAFVVAEPFSLRWFGGLTAAVLSYFSFATGVAAILVAGALISLQMGTRVRRRRGREYAGLFVLALIAGMMILWTISRANSTTTTPLAFIIGFVVLAGPTIVGTIVIQIPVIWFIKHTVARRPVISDPAWVAIGIAGWVLLQLVLIAYGRGTVFGVRYLDILLPMYPVALVAVFTYADATRGMQFEKYTRRASVAWVFGIVTAVALLGYFASILQSIDWSRSANQQMSKVQAYLHTGDRNDLRPKVGGGNTVDVSFPNAQKLASILDKRDIRAILPPQLRPADADIGQARNRMWLRGRFASSTAATMHVVLSIGPAFLAVGVGLFFAIGARRKAFAAD